MRRANEIDDIVLRELQAGMDAEEVRLLGQSSLNDRSVAAGSSQANARVSCRRQRPMCNAVQ